MAWNNKTYYSSTKKRIGKEGDFYTSPYVHSAFGSALGRQVAQCWEILEKPKQFTIFEFGGGDGKLAYAILDFLEKNYSSCYKTIEYIISDYHDLSQHDNNRWKKVQPFNKNFISYPFIGMVLAHEFIDALPVHRIICKPDGLREIMVRRSVDPKKQLSGDITEEEIPLSTPILEKFFERLGVSPTVNCQAEVNLDALDWLRWISLNMDRGFVITIDYGNLAPELFTQACCNGTVRSFFQHQIISDLYKHPEEQDLTSHVNFSSLIIFGEDLGIIPVGLTLQIYFLLGLDILSLAPPEELTIVKRLILPEGMGSSYKVLIQHKGCSPPTLDGLSLRTIPISNH